MKILILADWHNASYQDFQDLKNIDKSLFDLIVTLGDIHGLFLRPLREAFPDTLIIGVLGNHDEIGKFVHYGIKDMNGESLEIEGFKIVGIDGSVKYKNNDRFPLYSQEEMIVICDDLDKADIIISHNSPWGIHDREDELAHQGFKGLLNYIEKHNPKYCLHGHQHIDKTTVYKDTKILCVYGTIILDLETGNIVKLN